MSFLNPVQPDPHVHQNDIIPGVEYAVRVLLPKVSSWQFPSNFPAVAICVKMEAVSVDHPPRRAKVPEYLRDAVKREATVLFHEWRSGRGDDYKLDRVVPIRRVVSTWELWAERPHGARRAASGLLVPNTDPSQRDYRDGRVEDVLI